MLLPVYLVPTTVLRGPEAAGESALRPPGDPTLGNVERAGPEELREPRAAGPGACALRVTCVVRQNLGVDRPLFFAAPAAPGEAAVIARATFAEDREAGPAGAGASGCCALVSRRTCRSSPGTRWTSPYVPGRCTTSTPRAARACRTAPADARPPKNRGPSGRARG
ncbi:hypothetical protein [Streptomyces sp. CMB-StM0423]|uniref:hypothetical protein n=1 Tax=Streptomyces sp. CMB-StM0423 TaxID=2059884 RepID=UPI0018FE7E84|nr:hypothetical protein [Streptomyces sp. CMB-StM0423]